MPEVFDHRSGRLSPARQACDASGAPDGGTPGGRRRRAFPPRQLASVARPPRVCPLRHPAALDGGGGHKRRKGRGTARVWPGHGRRCRATWRPLHSMRGPPVSSRPSTSGRTNGCARRSSLTTPIRTTSPSCGGAERRRWMIETAHARASRPLARRSLPHRAAWSLVMGVLSAAPSMSSRICPKGAGKRWPQSATVGPSPHPRAGAADRRPPTNRPAVWRVKAQRCPSKAVLYATTALCVSNVD